MCAARQGERPRGPGRACGEAESSCLSRSERAEIARRLRDLDDPVRYVVYSEWGLSRRPWRWFLDVGSGTFCSDLEMASLFKRRDVAAAVAWVYADREGARASRLLCVARLTTRGGLRRILRWHEPAPRGLAPRGQAG